MQGGALIFNLFTLTFPEASTSRKWVKWGNLNSSRITSIRETTQGKIPRRIHATARCQCMTVLLKDLFRLFRKKGSELSHLCIERTYSRKTLKALFLPVSEKSMIWLESHRSSLPSHLEDSTQTRKEVWTNTSISSLGHTFKLITRMMRCTRQS